MKTTILKEEGFELACRGMAYSYFDPGVQDPHDWWVNHKSKAMARARKLADKDGGHNKFLESITVWIDITASRAFWQEMDTYRVGITKQSTSTMHTLSKRRPVQEDFEAYTLPQTVMTFQEIWDNHRDDIMVLKENLPEGFLQTRLLVTNYKTLRNIVLQREKHRYLHWRTFCDALREQLEHPELIWNNHDQANTGS
jgi:hypothetical protein